MDRKFDFNDISVMPDIISEISTRNDINIFDMNDKLPLIVSPMDTVVDEFNYKIFKDLGMYVCVPRYTEHIDDDEIFISYGLKDIEKILINGEKLPKRVLIDIANGHSRRLIDASKKIKEDYECELMAGNIANPETFRVYSEIGIDYARVGIGAGHACTTSANSSVHYPMGSLIKECYDIKKEINSKTKIVADGGFKNFDDVIKAIGLGADIVMLGNIINKSIESCGDNHIFVDDKYVKISIEEANRLFEEGNNVYKLYRGMSTKEVQKKWNNEHLRTSEGIQKYNRVEYNIHTWVDNFKEYLQGAMSYSNFNELFKFKGNIKYVFITENAYQRFYK